MNAKHALSAAVGCLCLGGVLAWAQSPSPEQTVSIHPRARATPAAADIRRATFRLDVKMVQIPVSVTDLRDRPVLDMKKSQFRVFEDDVEQKVSAFAMTDGPVSAGVVFDTSGSMRKHINVSREAMRQFLLTSIPGDEFFLVLFNDIPNMVSPLPSSAREISKTLGSADPRGWTAMNDAVFRSLQEIRRAANPRRALLVLTDGVDNNSRYSDGELLSLSREADASIFAIGLFEKPRLLEKLADETGGRVIWVHKIAELPDAMETLSVQIRNQYVLGYFSNRPQNDGKYHKVRVEVQPQAEAGPLRVSWRRGYIAP